MIKDHMPKFVRKPAFGNCNMDARNEVVGLQLFIQFGIIHRQSHRC